MTRLQVAEQLRKVLQMFAMTLSDDEAMEVATVYPKYEVGKAYQRNEFFTYGENAVGDPQLYRVIQEHVSQIDWVPDVTPSIYKAIGIDINGYPIWSRPSGVHDAYNVGDCVSFNGAYYVSLISGNVYSPNEYPSGWEVCQM